MNVLLTGCAGFIGARVGQQLLDAGHAVAGIDDLNAAYDVRLKEWRLARLLTRPNFRFHRGSITDRQQIASATEGMPVDAVINLAARAGVRQSVRDPASYVETNVTGAVTLLEWCRGRGVRKFVLASTSSLYGARNPRPFREDANTDGPLSPYAASKKAAEAMCYTYHYLHGIDVTVLRYFTVYGPAGRPDMSLFRFVQWVSEGRPVLIYGDGRQERDFTFVDDIASGTVAALRPVGYEIINLGSDQPIVLADALRLVEELVGARAQVVHQKPHPADVAATWADIGKARRLLDWAPRWSFRDGVAALVAWYREHRAWASQIVTDER